MRSIIDIDGDIYEEVLDESVYTKYGQPVTGSIIRKYRLGSDQNLPDGSNPIYWKDKSHFLSLYGDSKNEVVVVGLSSYPHDSDNPVFTRDFDWDDIDDACEVFDDIVDDIRHEKDWDIYRIASVNGMIED